MPKMTYGNPETFADLPDRAFYPAPANQGHVQEVERQNRILEEKVNYLSDPTLRKPFEIPDLPAGYQEHKTDDAAVKAAGKDLTSRLDYVKKQIGIHSVDLASFEIAVSQRAANEAEYQSRLTQAVENGEDIPDPVDQEDLTPLHKELNKLESAITVGTRVAHESRIKLNDAYEILYASESYRKWADSEKDKRWADFAKAVELASAALAVIEGIDGKLPHPYGDENGILFEAPVNLGRGGLDPNARGQAKPSIRGALNVLAQNEVKAYKLSQLDDEEKQDYAERAARAKVEREDTRTPEEKRQDAESERYADYLDNGGVLK